MLGLLHCCRRKYITSFSIVLDIAQLKVVRRQLHLKHIPALISLRQLFISYANLERIGNMGQKINKGKLIFCDLLFFF